MNAKEAKEKAEEALTQSERTSKEIGKIILEGDSSPLAGQLSIGADGTEYNNPQDRFTKETKKINEQLAKKSNDVEVTSMLNTKRDKSVPISLNDASSDLLGAIQGGEGANFNLESTPRDYSVTPKKTTFTHLVSIGKNLFNPKDKDVLSGKILNDDGTIINNGAYDTSGFMRVSPGDNIIISKNDNKNSVLARAYVFYDADKKPVTGYSEPSNPEFPLEVPDHSYYFRVSYSNESYSDYQVEIGNVKTSYEPYYESYKIDEELQVMLGSLAHNNGVFVLKPSSPNLYDPDDKDIIPDYLLTETGNYSKNNTYSVSGKIKVNKGDQVFVSKKSSKSIVVRSYGFFDNDNKWIEGDEWASGKVLEQPFIAPKDGYFRATYTNDDNEGYQIEIGQGVTPYQPYEEKFFFDQDSIALPEHVVIGRTGYVLSDVLGPWYRKKVIFNGDSITAGYTPSEYNEDHPSFAKITADSLGMFYDNYAVGGSTLAVNSEDSEGRSPLINRYHEMDNDADLVVIAIGTNDFTYSWTPIGDMDSRDNESFYGALHNLCLGLLEKYLGKQILFMTPIKRSDDPNKENTLGYSLSDYADVIKEVCGFYGVPVLDMYNECFINPSLDIHVESFIPDRVHPNGEGHKIMSRRVIGYLRQLA